MQDSIDPKRLTRSRRTPLLAAILVSAVLVAGCGGSSPSPTTTAGGASAPASTVEAGAATTTGAATATSEGTTSSGSTAPSPLAFARCMRANGVPNFQDPDPGGGFALPTGDNPAATPAFKAAQAKCQKLLPNGGAGPAFSEQALVQLRKIAQCMRQHGVPQFPDPKRASQTSVPSTASSGASEITDYRGVILEFPATINMQSPSYKQAASACGASFLV